MTSRLVAISFVVPVRFAGERIDIADASKGFTFEERFLQREDGPVDLRIRIKRGVRFVDVPASNCVREWEVVEDRERANVAQDWTPSSSPPATKKKGRG